MSKPWGTVPKALYGKPLSDEELADLCRAVEFGLSNNCGKRLVERLLANVAQNKRRAADYGALRKAALRARAAQRAWDDCPGRVADVELKRRLDERDAAHKALNALLDG